MMPTEKTTPTTELRETRTGPSLRGRLRLGVAPIVAAFALLSIAAVASLDQLGGAIATILRENYATVVLCEQMKEALERQDSAALFAVTGREDLSAATLSEGRQRFEEALAREEKNITVPGEGELVREIRERYGAYAREADRVLALPRAAQQDAYFRELLPRFKALDDLVQRVRRLNQENMESADRDAKRLAQQTMHAALFVTVTATLFMLWFAYWFPRSISRPLEALTRSAKAIGEGNLDVSVEAPKVAELSALALTFNRMAERLRAYRESSLGELLAAKDLARSTLACMLDPVLVLDREGGVLLANDAAEAAFGVGTGSADELRARGARLPNELAMARDKVLETGEPVLPRSLSEAARWRAEGGEKYYLVRALPLRAGPNEKPSAVVVAQDVTRFRRIDELKSDMVATVSHEFKTPLTSLRMATYLLLEPTTGPLTEAQTELVQTARDDTERLRAMVEELLDVVRIESEAGALHRVPVEPIGLLCEVADAHRTVARDKGVRVEVEPAAEPLGLVSVDPERLSIALANLLANAVRHTPPGGSVRLSGARVDRALQIKVTDTGEGIDPKLLPRIFDRSVTSAGDGDGQRHGLGLTIAREIVLQHGGELSAASEPGKGSTFTLILPLEATG